MKWIILILAVFASNAKALPMLGVSESAWGNLAKREQAEIQRSYIIEVFRDDSFGIIIDNQGVDRSTPGNASGTILGGAIADAAYLDRAFGGGSYSAKTHLGATLLGGLIGSTLNQTAQQQYQFRYTIKLQNGNVVYRDILSPVPFRHTAGLCVLLPDITIASNQDLCTLTPDALRQRHLSQFATQQVKATNSPRESRSGDHVDAKNMPFTPPIEKFVDNTVNCKINSLAPVQTTLEKCNAINGKVIDE